MLFRIPSAKFVMFEPPSGAEVYQCQKLRSQAPIPSRHGFRSDHRTFKTALARHSRAGPDHRRFGRRSERHRDIFPGRRPNRLRLAVAYAFYPLCGSGRLSSGSGRDPSIRQYSRAAVPSARPCAGDKATPRSRRQPRPNLRNMAHRGLPHNWCLLLHRPSLRLVRQ